MRYLLALALIFIGYNVNAQLSDNQTSIIQDRINEIPDSLGKQKLDYYNNTSIVIFHSGDYDEIEERVEALEEKIDALIDANLFSKKEITAHHHKNFSYIMYEQDTLMKISEPEGNFINIKNLRLAQYYRDQIENLYQDVHLKVFKAKIIRLGIFLLIYIIGLFILKYLYRKLVRQISNSDSLVYTLLRKLRMYNIQDKDLENATEDFSLLAKWVYYVAIVIVTYLTLPIMLNVFIITRSVGLKMVGYITDPFFAFVNGIVKFFPTIIEITVIIVIFRLFIKLLNYFFDKIREDKIKINGFYKEWAKPTSNIIKLILYAFLLTLIIPLLPGAGSDTFKGVSVFVGLLLSLGSTSVISNGLSGVIMTYMRPFKLGDRIEVEMISGVVVQKNLLVTRLRTPKNVIVTIPNSKILSGHSKNFSTAAERSNLIIFQPVTIGYDVDWRIVHRLLKNAAKITNGIIEKSGKESFVLQKSLGEYWVEYEINCYVAQADKYLEIKSELLANILDEFNKEGIEILSPRYSASRDGNASTAHPIPEDVKIEELEKKEMDINDKINERADLEDKTQDTSKKRQEDEEKGG